ncbi:hypothetical protein ABVN58_05755 [Fusobacterium polymorphum]|jgi:putative uncharacterized protein FNV0866|uniref:Uncharacterized protein n=1 Tax=Fusobacterium nucleatum CTI-6 TaxID=1316587 RepID=U7TTH0_FUSNU|nr:hypothetical protein [Fusobacterium nucleatum]ERT47678.1 hypothetical protein HMPREF1767_01239 [Fusobacterium nucleatum CTI-6]DAT02189.1 MAG TPA: hypothetical protein [Bacteriophage sp.]
MEKEKVLEIEYQEVFDEVAVRIKNINNNFFSDGFYKEDVEKYNCSREESPYNSEERVLFLGDDIIISNKSIYCYTQEKIKEIKEFVDYVNEKYGIPKRWRGKRSDKYFSIFGDSEISETTDNYFPEDQRRYEWGNYFKTLEEAEKVKEKLDEFWAKVRAGEIKE